MNVLYSEYEDPPEPPQHLWLIIDFTKIDFRDMDHIKMIYTYVPETYITLNSLYKIYQKNLKSYLDVTKKYDLYIYSPKIMKKIKK